MINNLLDSDENIKDKLLKLSFREIRLEAKKLSIHLYSRKTKKELVQLLLKDQKKLLIENNSNDDVVAEEDRLAIEKAKQEERIAFLKKMQLIKIEKANAKENEYIISNKNKNLKRLLSKSFPNKKITVTDNKDGSQTILIN
ncbi:hypothetical protein EU96_0944 [Prochlorococcus marinus str. MIT 9302]|uniref:Uncharacterized protein n=1 Tax=Prochlorococcus marinus str. MIT 9302 TaxID=74545 RepID=A0A0A2A7S0_PROMR|nr:hypothetical protein [Prochlorococcus marinus]KGF97957.1 hypothetical protein EU96_0944 [Prochlorococcus marinus str. MIT 9302]